MKKIRKKWGTIVFAIEIIQPIIASNLKIRYNLSAFVTPPVPAPSGVVASARLCCLSRVPPAVCPSLLESTTTVCTSFLQSLSTYVHTPKAHSILRFVPLVESGICLLVDVATLSTIYDVRHPLLLPPGYPTQELISRPQAVRPPSSTPREKKNPAFFVTPTLPAPCVVVASARLCCLSRVPPAVYPSLLESTTTVCTSSLQSLSTYVHTPTPHSILRFRPAPQTPDLHTSNLPH